MRAALVIALAACGGAKPTNPAPAPAASVGFDNDFNLIFIQVAVGNAPPRWFILDSGADQTLLDAAAAKELGVATGGIQGTAEPGGEIQIAHARDVTFHVGTAPFTAHDVWVTSLAPLQRFVGRRFDGILGHEFLQRYVTKIAYSTHRITLYEPATFHDGGATAVPIEIVSREAFVVATIDTGKKRVPARLKLDTGSVDTLGLNGSFVQQTALFGAEQPKVPKAGVALGGLTEGFMTRVPKLVLGPYELGPIVLGYSAETKRTGDAGTIGAEVLRRFDITFDYTRHRLLLEPNAAMHTPFAVDSAGLFGATYEGDFRRFMILGVTPGTPAAEADLRPGDEIVAIDGVGFERYGFAKLFDRVHAAGPLQLTIRRDGSERAVNLRLRPVL